MLTFFDNRWAKSLSCVLSGFCVGNVDLVAILSNVRFLVAVRFESDRFELLTGFEIYGDFAVLFYVKPSDIPFLESSAWPFHLANTVWDSLVVLIGDFP